jgi:RNA polymerase sigma-70 factor, ECF subfamily
MLDARCWMREAHDVLAPGSQEPASGDCKYTHSSMPSRRVDDALVQRLYRQANAERWRVPVARFAEALEASADRVFGDRDPGTRELDRYLTSLHLEDLALACACSAGDEAAWEHFIREQRPRLYRAADALASGGRAREIADSIYADLYGLEDRGQGRRSLFRYFHGRSGLATWLRAVLAQRHVDRLRAERRVEPLPEDDSAAALTSSSRPADPERTRYVAMIRHALGGAVARLDARDRLRLSCYYAQGLTLAETGRLLREHEATASRQLAKTRRAIRDDVERQLRADAGLSDAEIALCFESVSEDPGPLDVAEMLGDSGQRKKSGSDRSL